MPALLEDLDPPIRKSLQRRLGVAGRKDVIVAAPDQQGGHPELRHTSFDHNAISDPSHPPDAAQRRPGASSILRPGRHPSMVSNPLVAPDPFPPAPADP